MKTAILSFVTALVLGAPALAQHHDHRAAPTAATSVQGVGVVRAVNAGAKTITLAHEPIAALGWPAMTMDFGVSSAELLAGLRVGQKIAFELQGQTITALRPA